MNEIIIDERFTVLYDEKDLDLPMQVLKFGKPNRATRMDEFTMSLVLRVLQLNKDLLAKEKAAKSKATTKKKVSK